MAIGVRAPNSPLRAAVTAMALAAPALQAAAQTGQVGTCEGAPGVAPVGQTVQTQPVPAPPKRSPAHYLWAVLIARFLISCGTDRSYPKSAIGAIHQRIGGEIHPKQVKRTLEELTAKGSVRFEGDKRWRRYWAVPQ